MGYDEKNFFYLKGTNIEKYYDDLITAEDIFDDYGEVTKIILRKVTEEILRNIACKYNMACNIDMDSLINNIKYNCDINFPEKICKYVDIIRINANRYEEFDNYNINIDLKKDPIELLKIMDEFLKWYIKEVELQQVIESSNFKFKTPNTVNFKNNELKKIRTEISLKDTQINNLRMKIIELGSKSKSVIQLNNIIIAIKEEKSHLETKEKSLSKSLQEQKTKILKIKENHYDKIKKIEELKKYYKEIENLISNQEAKLVKAELENKDLTRMIKCLYEQDDSILKKDMIIKDQLEQIRKSYKTELGFSKKYIDILNTIEFSYNEEIKKKLNDQKINIEIQMNFEDKAFNDLINDYEKNIIETKRRVEIYREILKDKLNREIKYREFYKGFLNLSGNQLRTMYILSTNFDENNNVTIKFKDSFLKSNKDKFMEYIEQNTIKLKNISDEEIKLILYYRLIKLANLPIKNIYNRKYFIETLDNIVDKSYEILDVNKISKENINILETIRQYYLEQTLINLKNICLSKNIRIENILTENIYKNIQKLSKDKIEIIYKNLNIEVLSEETIKRAINDNVFGVISMIASCYSIQTYKLVYNCIFIIFKLIEKKYLDFKDDIKETLILDFLNENFMMNLFILEAKSRFNKFQIKKEQILLLFIMQIIIGEIDFNNEDSDLKSYEKIIKVWKSKQQIYSDVYLKKKSNQEELELISLNMKKLEINNEQLEQAHMKLIKEYKEKEDDFFKIVLSSDEIKLLPSYLQYKVFNNSKEAEHMKDIKKTNNRYETLNNILAGEIWDKYKKNFIDNIKPDSVETLLLEEAKVSNYFKDEYQVLLDLKEKIEELKILIDKSKKELEDQSYSANIIKNEIMDCEKRLNIMKELYLDIEEIYWS